MTTIRRFIRAVAARDEVAARDACAASAWDAPGNSLAHLFRQLAGRDRALQLRPTEPPRTSESMRIAVHCAVTRRRGEPVSRLWLLCDRVPRRLVGWTRSDLVSMRFLDGLVAPDIGLHSLEADEMAQALARQLADDLLLAHAGDEHSRARLVRSIEVTGSDPAVIGYLDMRAGAGAQLDIVRALRLVAPARIAVHARLVRAEACAEDIWLYAVDSDAGEMSWRAHRTVFDVDVLLG